MKYIYVFVATCLTAFSTAVLTGNAGLAVSNGVTVGFFAIVIIVWGEMKKNIAEQQRQIDEMKRKLEEVKGKE